MFKKFAGTVIVLLIIAFAVLIGISLRKSEQAVPSMETDVSMWNEYTDSRYHFSFKYPPNLEVVTRQAPGQWQVDVRKPDSEVDDAYDDSEWIMSFWVEEYETSLDKMYGMNPHNELEKAVDINFKGDGAVLVAACEVGVPYDPPCVLPETDAEVMARARKIIIDHKGTIYTFSLPYYNNDAKLFNDVLSTLRFKD